MRVGNYEVVRHLGAGGMSTVWLARGPVPATLTAPASNDGLVVLKQQIRAEDDGNLREESRVGARLRHPGVVQTLDCIDDANGRPVLVLEYVPGASLAQLRKRGALAAPAVCRIGADVAEALTALHDARDERGNALCILHRDVTPANIIVSHDGSARLIDLGIARSSESAGDRTAAGSVKGTLRYVAPELFDGKPHTPSTDLWALGVCLFEAALGRPAAVGSEALILAAVVRGHLLNLQDNEHIDPLLHDVIERLCTRDGNKRYPHARIAARRLAAGDLGDGAMIASTAVYAAVEVPRAPAQQPHGQTQTQAQAQAQAHTAPAAATADDGFARMAASTYCGGDDDDPFSDSQPSTVITGSVPGAPSANEQWLTAALLLDDPVTALDDGDGSALSVTVGSMDDAARVAPTMPHGVPAPSFDSAFDSRAFEAPPTTPGTPGGMRKGPARQESWDIPQPITGEDSPRAPAPTAPSFSTSPPSSMHLGPQTASTVDELPHSSLDAPPLATLDDASSSQLVDLRAHATGAPSLLMIVVVVVAVALAILVALSRA